MRACVLVVFLFCGSVPSSTGPAGWTWTKVPLGSHWSYKRRCRLEHGGPEPEHWIQAEPTVPFTARQGAAEEASGPGPWAGHIPVLGLRSGGLWDEQCCAGSRWQRVPARFWETQASTTEEEGVCVLRGRHHWWLRYCELHQLGGTGGKCLWHKQSDGSLLDVAFPFNLPGLIGLCRAVELKLNPFFCTGLPSHTPSSLQLKVWEIELLNSWHHSSANPLRRAADHTKTPRHPCDGFQREALIIHVLILLRCWRAAKWLFREKKGKLIHEKK